MATGPAPNAALGARFVDALVARDHAQMRAVLHPEVDFRGLTPNRNWEASDAAGAVAIVLDSWFLASDVVEELELVEHGTVADRERLRFRIRGHNDDGPFVVEQQAYLSERDERIGWMRVVCSGFRPPA